MFVDWYRTLKIAGVCIHFFMLLTNSNTVFFVFDAVYSIKIIYYIF